ncbi:MAG: hypothetical protein AAFQ82_16250, partial [Myxococcota bacterium]
VVLTLNGKPITRFSDAVLLIQTMRPGDEMAIELMRSGNGLKKTLKLAGRQGAMQVRMGPFRWRGPTPLIDEHALQESMKQVQKRLRGMDGRKLILMEQQRRGFEARIRSLEDKIADLERRLGEQT